VQSRWGHALLRFVEADPDPLDDPILGFVADPGGPTLSLWKGLVGGYPVIADLGPLHWALGTYVRDQLRPVSRWVLPTTGAQRRALVEALARWYSTSAPGRYTFAGNNCAWALLRFLDEAGLVPVPPDRGLARRVPTRLPEVLRASLREAPPIPSVGATIDRAAQALGVPFAELRAGVWPPYIGPLLALDAQDRLRLLLNVDVPPDAAEALRASLPEGTRPDLVALYGIAPLPPGAYAP
jgi:hypothetical protein